MPANYYSGVAYMDDGIPRSVCEGMILNFVQEEIVQLYAATLPEVTVPTYPVDIDTRRDQIGNDVKYIPNFITRIDKFPNIMGGIRIKHNCSLLGETYSEENTAYLNLNKFTKDGKELVSANLMIFQVSPRPMVLSFLSSLEKDKVITLGLYAAGEYESKAKKFLIEVYSNIYDKKNHHPVSVIGRVLREVRAGRLGPEPTSFYHTDTEMFIFDKMIRLLQSQKPPKMPGTRIVHGFSRAHMAVDSEFNYGDSRDDIISQHDVDWDSFTLYDLSAREWRFIANYAKSGKYFETDPVLPLRQIIGNPRYGRTFKFEYQDMERSIMIGVMITDEDGKLKFILHHPTACGRFEIYMVLTVSDEVSISSLEDFKSNRIIQEIDSVMMFRKLEQPNIIFPRDSDEYDSLIPWCFKFEPNIEGLINVIISLLITLHYRPERTKMIRESRARSSSVPREHNPETHPDDYVTVHILKPLREAKEYIKSVAGTNRFAEYVTPEWEREGHTRQMKNGKIVYIPATTCHRRLPLTEKEIRIKL